MTLSLQLFVCSLTRKKGDGAHPTPEGASGWTISTPGEVVLCSDRRFRHLLWQVQRFLRRCGARADAEPSVELAAYDDMGRVWVGLSVTTRRQTHCHRCVHKSGADLWRVASLQAISTEAAGSFGQEAGSTSSDDSDGGCSVVGEMISPQVQRYVTQNHSTESIDFFPS